MIRAMKVRRYLYPLNHTWIVLVDPEREDAVPAERKGKSLGEIELESGFAGADPAEVRRRLGEHGYCLVQPAAGRLRQIGTDRPAVC